MPSKGWEHFDASACIPNSNGFVRRPRDDFGSIGEKPLGQVWYVCHPEVLRLLDEGKSHELASTKYSTPRQDYSDDLDGRL